MKLGQPFNPQRQILSSLSSTLSSASAVGCVCESGKLAASSSLAVAAVISYVIPLFFEDIKRGIDEDSSEIK